MSDMSIQKSGEVKADGGPVGPRPMPQLKHCWLQVRAWSRGFEGY